jgi:hypothetical protein
MIEELYKKHPMIQMWCKLKGRGLVVFVKVGGLSCLLNF